ncbi:AraC family transcriptional regulator ligand-binding domain-containing protein [Streptomyces sp. NBC_01180]|uniref:AraC family transcriptional regulator ligand-binding domain-containing protein n=1 Tax=Streptomyces sp. NBC_01180 TaxID=2903763 RepID=UPI00386BA85C|nr:AraC family transcriptional regulator ligand-binding domain-containing protein [Streptomyces sp. NBC_01180]
MQEADPTSYRNTNVAPHPSVSPAISEGCCGALDIADVGRPDAPVERAVPEGPTAHLSVARLLLAGLEGVGGDGAALTYRAGGQVHMSGGDFTRVPTECLSRLWRLGLNTTDDPCLGVKTAGHWRFGRLQLMDYLVGNAATLAEAIGLMAQYSALLNTAPNEVRLTGGAGTPGTVTYQIRSGDPAVDAVASQYALAAVLLRASYVTGREIRPLHVGLTSAAPPRHRELADRFSARRIDFGAETTTMTLTPADLALSLPDADAQLGEVLRQHAAVMIAAQVSSPVQAVPWPWTDRLRQVIAAHLADGGLSLPAVARTLALSPRSLQRRLADEDTTWRDVVDRVRRDRASTLLAQGLSRKQVAARLGFGDARALRGALHRWRTDPGL